MANKNPSAANDLSLSSDNGKKPVVDLGSSERVLKDEKEVHKSHHEGSGSGARKSEIEELPNGNMDDLKNMLNEILVVVIPVKFEIPGHCIYKVPERIRQNNPEAYNPIILSIGPFHNPHGSNKDKNNFYEMEQLKREHFKGFLNRTTLSKDDLVSKVQKWENKIQRCYAGPVDLNINDLKIIIVDSCFIIEHFLRWREKDPSLKSSLRSEIERDLLFLENQVPFFFLEKIYKLANRNLEDTPEPPPFITITTDYFQQFNQQNRNSEALRPKHFTDLIRSFLLSPSLSEQEEIGGTIEHVYSVSQLSEAGLSFEVSESKCLLDWKFDKGVFKIPCFYIDDVTERYMRNIMAFEQCHMFNSSSRYITQYFAILNFLINTEKDVSILVDKKIIVNWMGDANKAATMVNTLCKNVTMPTFSEDNVTLCQELNRFYKDPRNKNKAIFVAEYFSTPWKRASTITAVLILLFTLIQAVCSIWSLVK